MATLAISLLAAVIAASAYFAWRWSNVLAELSRGLDALRAGDKARVVRAGAQGPIGRLVRSFNAAATEVQTRAGHLEQERQRLLVVLEAMAEAVIAVDSRLRLLFANTSAHRLFGLNAASVGRLVPAIIRSPQVQDAVEASLRIVNPTAYQGELTFPGRDSALRGSGRVLSVCGTPLPGHPSPGAVLVFHDVTELRRLERMRQDFVANASHELKTPLASIKAYTESLLDWALSDCSVNVRFLQRIDEQAERLNQLVLDLLSLSRIESGQGLFDHQPLPIVAVLASCVEAHRDRAAARDIKLSLEPGDWGQAPWVCADEEAVRQIADNLIDNAIKYTRENGSVRVICSVSGIYLDFAVADTGIGIPRDELPRIFERFYRVDKARSRELGGTGLGLSIVKHLVQAIGGHLNVTSRLGSGSTFTVRLPRCDAPGTSLFSSRRSVPSDQLPLPFARRDLHDSSTRTPASVEH
jgi:two-component system phosphate regulon sensor histidine kinase PhoR